MTHRPRCSRQSRSVPRPLPPRPPRPGVATQRAGWSCRWGPPWKEKASGLTTAWDPEIVVVFIWFLYGLHGSFAVSYVSWFLMIGSWLMVIWWLLMIHASCWELLGFVSRVFIHELGNGPVAFVVCRVNAFPRRQEGNQLPKFWCILEWGIQILARLR